METPDDRFARLVRERNERKAAEKRLTEQYRGVPIEDIPEQYRLIVDSWRRYLGEEPQS